MYDTAQLHTEIRTFLEKRIEAGQIVQKDWLCHEILLQHPLPDFPDSDFTVCCRRIAVTDAVNKVNRLFKEEAQSVAQGELPLAGYAYLQKAYPVERDGMNYLVPIFQLTHAERLAKVALYREMAKGCQGHADELERFIGLSEAAD